MFQLNYHVTNETFWHHLDTVREVRRVTLRCWGYTVTALELSYKATKEGPCIYGSFPTITLRFGGYSIHMWEDLQYATVKFT